ncbi:MAG TPA: thioredoxin [Erysipelotrichaceae bacterium]|nr:thioredoxin [Erysipelotrichaceae bacterium]
MVKILDSTNFDEEVSEGVVLVDFYADWCGPCKMLAPVLDELAEDLAGKAKVVKVNVDTENALAAKYQVSSIPSLKVFKDGKVVDETMGFQPKAKLAALVEKSL